MHFTAIISSIFALSAVSTAVALPAAGLPEVAVADKRAIVEERNPFDPFGNEKRAVTLGLSRRPLSTSTSSTKAAVATPAANTPPNSWSQGILNAHNAARKTHGAGNLVWADDLTAYAKTWAEKCGWYHGGYPSGTGQNLAAGASSASVATQSPETVVNMWMAEEKDYNPSAPVYSHFTQVVWKATTQLGCYQAQCANSNFKNQNGQLVFNNSQLKSVAYTVCNYRKAGNVQGQYAANVQKII